MRRGNQRHLSGLTMRTVGNNMKTDDFVSEFQHVSGAELISDTCGACTNTNPVCCIGCKCMEARELVLHTSATRRPTLTQLAHKHGLEVLA